MVFECSFCLYKSKRKFNLQSHVIRKHGDMNASVPDDSDTFHTLSETNAIVQNALQNTHATFHRVHSPLSITQATVVETNANAVEKNPVVSITSPSPAKNKCKACGKCFSTKSYLLNKHSKICKGVMLHPLQCDICQKFFSSSGAKCRHKKNVRCKPPPASEAPGEPDDQPEASEAPASEAPASEPDELIESSSSEAGERRPVRPTQIQRQSMTKYAARGGSCACPYCQREFSREDNLKRHIKACRVKELSELGTISINSPRNPNATGKKNNGEPVNITNNTTIINTNVTTTNVTNNNITIQYRSFDSPCLDHIDKDIVKALYFENNRNLKKLIKAGVCRIWKTPENNTFRLPFTDKPKGLPNTEIMQVHCDGEDQLFPAHHVVDVLLQKCATVCERYLREHYYSESIPGTGVLKHANVLEELAIEFQETWDMDSQFRNEYKPFVRSAILECLQRRKEEEEEALSRQVLP